MWYTVGKTPCVLYIMGLSNSILLFPGLKNVVWPPIKPVEAPCEFCALRSLVNVYQLRMSPMSRKDRDSGNPNCGLVVLGHKVYCVIPWQTGSPVITTHVVGSAASTLFKIGMMAGRFIMPCCVTTFLCNTDPHLLQSVRQPPWILLVSIIIFTSYLIPPILNTPNVLYSLW